MKSTFWLVVVGVLSLALTACSNIPTKSASSQVPLAMSASLPDSSQPPEQVIVAASVTQLPPVAALQPTNFPQTADLWQRIRNGFKMPGLDTDLVHEQERWHATRPEYLARMTERSKRYLHHITNELQARGMPTELALLPFIESAYNPQAVSSAKAAGIWQFMPGTGKDFELAQNHFRDDRREVLKSTRAALAYLERLYTKFGDWHLALAAYNWGEGSVEHAIAKNRRAAKPRGYLDLDMPTETRLYVPRLQAIKNIISDPDAFNAKLPLIEDHPFFKSVAIQQDIDVALAAKLADIKLEDFKALNPAVHRPVLLAAGSPQILLPWENAPIFERNMRRHGSINLASWTVWVVPTTLRPAEAAKRVGMREQELREVNEIPSKKLVKAGSTLLIRRKSSVASNVSAVLANTGQLVLAADVPARKRPVRQTPKARIVPRQSA